eukprot:TRINITY_DN5218_c0_g1_i1.p1 TRINITY_DN5218_c0_g1~~TRINITY_DN5218_c0_g1_i1.p1  ORF type:complete len:1369 (-),score=370.83 TRINITY_DN5218_c0_g1_i1:203-4309(-)
MLMDGKGKQDSTNCSLEPENILNDTAIVSSAEGEPFLMVGGVSISATTSNDGPEVASEDKYSHEDRLGLSGSFVAENGEISVKEHAMGDVSNSDNSNAATFAKVESENYTDTFRRRIVGDRAAENSDHKAEADDVCDAQNQRIPANISFTDSSNDTFSLNNDLNIGTISTTYFPHSMPRSSQLSYGRDRIQHLCEDKVEKECFPLKTAIEHAGEASSLKDNVAASYAEHVCVQEMCPNKRITSKEYSEDVARFPNIEHIQTKKMEETFTPQVTSVNIGAEKTFIQDAVVQRKDPLLQPIVGDPMKDYSESPKGRPSANIEATPLEEEKEHDNLLDENQERFAPTVDPAAPFQECPRIDKPVLGSLMKTKTKHHITNDNSNGPENVDLNSQVKASLEDEKTYDEARQDHSFNIFGTSDDILASKGMNSKINENILEVEQNAMQSPQNVDSDASPVKDHDTFQHSTDRFGGSVAGLNEKSNSATARKVVCAPAVTDSAVINKMDIAGNQPSSETAGCRGAKLDGCGSPSKKDVTRSSGDHESGNSLVGRTVRKKFGRKHYSGSVVSFDEENSWYKVTYEDGDEEDLEWEELKPVLLPLRERTLTLRSKRKNTHFLRPEGRSFKKVGKSRKSTISKGRKRGHKVSQNREHARAPKTKQDDSAHDDKTSPLKINSKGFITNNNKASKECSSQRHAVSRKRKAETNSSLQYEKGKRFQTSQSPLRASRHQSCNGKDKRESRDSIQMNNSEAITSSSMDIENSISKVCGTSRIEDHDILHRNHSSQGGGTSLIGRKTKKDFGGQMYAGEVIGYDENAGYYKVRYEDGDEEELEWNELEATLVDVGRKRLSFKDMLRARTFAVRATAKVSSTSDIDDESKVKETIDKNVTLDSTYDQANIISVSEDVREEDRMKDTSDKLLWADHSVKEVVPPRPLAAVRFASAADADMYEFYGWGEVAGYDRTKCPELRAAKLLPTSSPIVHLAASQHHLAAITANGQVWLWRNRHNNINTRCNEWEHISCLEDKGVVLVDVAGPDIDRVTSEYGADQEDQVPDPFYLVAIDNDGRDHVLQGSQPQEPVRTYQIIEEPRYRSLTEMISQSSKRSPEEVGKVVQVSVGVVEAPDESPFIGFITDSGHVYIRSATKDYMDEVNLVSGFTGKPIKIQCGRVFHAIIMTDDGRAWTWGQGYYPGAKSLGSVGFPVTACQPAVGTLVGRKVIDVGCYGEDFIALTNDGDVHQWTHAVPNPAAGVYNVPATPLYGHGPCIPHGEKLKQVSIGAGVCAGITENGTVHTWRTDMKGGFSGLAASVKEGLTPLCHEENNKDTSVACLGHRFATKVLCVAGSLIVVVRKRTRGRIGSRKRVDKSKVESAVGEKH